MHSFPGIRKDLQGQNKCLRKYANILGVIISSHVTNNVWLSHANNSCSAEEKINILSLANSNSLFCFTFIRALQENWFKSSNHIQDLSMLYFYCISTWNRKMLNKITTVTDSFGFFIHKLLFQKKTRWGMVGPLFKSLVEN